MHSKVGIWSDDDINWNAAAGSSRRTAALWAFLSRSLHSRGVPEARARDLKQGTPLSYDMNDLGLIRNHIEKKPMSDGPIPKQFQKSAFPFVILSKRISLAFLIPPGNYTHAENEEACAKLWNVYVVEAERYDRGLVASWKGDMNGMLIFVCCSSL